MRDHQQRAVVALQPFPATPPRRGRGGWSARPAATGRTASSARAPRSGAPASRRRSPRPAFGSPPEAQACSRRPARGAVVAVDRRWWLRRPPPSPRRRRRSLRPGSRHAPRHRPTARSRSPGPGRCRVSCDAGDARLAGQVDVAAVGSTSPIRAANSEDLPAPLRADHAHPVAGMQGQVDVGQSSRRRPGAGEIGASFGGLAGRFEPRLRQRHAR